MELEALQQALPEITAAGATLVAISPQLPRYSEELAAKLGLTFDVLSDEGNRVASLYGLTFTLPDELKQLYVKSAVDLTKFNGDGSWTLPIPARFVIDRWGTIRAVDADPDYTSRPEPSQTVEILRNLGTQPRAR